MANAVSARLEGDDCQALVFWQQALRLLDEQDYVESVEIESPEPKSFDDIVVHYREGLRDDNGAVSVDCHQVKYHVHQSGLITGSDLSDPKFINATSFSFLQKLKGAVDKFGGVDQHCRYYLDNCYSIDPNDRLSELISNSDDTISVKTLLAASPNSGIGKLRKQWMSHLGVVDPKCLAAILAPLRITRIPSLTKLREDLNYRLRLVGLKPIPSDSSINDYLCLARDLIEKGTTKLTKKSLTEICRKEKLFATETSPYSNAIRIGIQSFTKNTAYLHDETYDTLDLQTCFNGRELKNHEDWNKTIAPVVNAFLEPRCKPGMRCLLALPAHGSIAVLAGSVVDTKSGTNIAVLQPSCSDIAPWPVGARPNSSRTSSPWEDESIHLNHKGMDVAIAVSVSNQIADDVKHYVKQELPSVAELVHCRFNQCGENAVSGPEEGWVAIEALVERIRQARTQSRLTGTLHLFFSMPNAMAFFLGRHHLVLGRTQVYEFNSGTRSYQPSILLPSY